MACSDIKFPTDCSKNKDPIQCNECQTVFYETKCQSVSFNTDCENSRPEGMSRYNCYACQNRMYQAQIVEGDLDNSMAHMGDYHDSVNRYGNEISKTFYIVVGIVGVVACSYYIR